jgi:NAD(P)-dependent dehydrogenase (short-subunit alcohol dehydrogenase family)
MPKLEGKVAVVTGAGGGIGRATSLALAREGAAIAVADINLETALGTVAAVRATGAVAEAIQFDISNEEEVKRGVAAIVARFGVVHVLDNNSTIAAHHHRVPDRTVTEMDVETWDRTMAVNLRGTMLMCKHVIPVMIKSGGGSIVNVSSGAAIIGDVRHAAYGVSKAGINSLTLYVAATYGKFGIRCNTVMPGPTMTRTFLELSPQARLDVYQKHMVLGRLVQPEDIANAVLFFACDDSAMITGENMCVDGGLLRVHPPYSVEIAESNVPVNDAPGSTTAASRPEE